MGFFGLLILICFVIAVTRIAYMVIRNRREHLPRGPNVTEEPRPALAEMPKVRNVPMANRQPSVVEETESEKAQELQPSARETLIATGQKTEEAVLVKTEGMIPLTEIQTSRARGTQAVVLNGANTIAAQETESTVTEQVQPLETEKAPLQGSEDSEAPRKREPIKRGGRPRGLAQCREEKQKPRSQQHRLKPEIVCWKRERQWVLAVELPEELLEKPGLTVHQNGSPLFQDESKEGCWRLEQAFGKVTVRWKEDEALQETNIHPGYNESEYLLFKLRGDLDEGRLVKYPSSGSYLVIVPENWKRDDVLGGQPPLAEPVCLTGYRAHFFDMDESSDEKIAFCLSDESRLVVPNAPRFGLVGNRLDDASEHMGPLFGEEPPRICAQDAQAWENVRTIVVGEEGSGRRRWRAEFSPNSGQTEQHLPSELADRKGGWYFLRFYDHDDRLIESIDFRFLSGLKEIRVLQPPPLPAENGHKVACVEFVHENDSIVQPASDLGKIEINCQDGKTILSIPPDPAYDNSRWLVGQERGPKVEVSINVERVWWALGEENIHPTEWQDQPFTLSRNDFSATSNKALWLRLPRPRWVDKVLVGFERSKARPYEVMVKEQTVAIPLREFGDSSEVADPVHEHRLRLWIARNQQELEGGLAVLPSSELAQAQRGAHLAQSSPQVWCGSGRHKTAVAKAVMRNGGGGINVNGQHLDDYFKPAPPEAKQFLKQLLGLEEVCGVLSRMEVEITVKGSSPKTMRQLKAVAHAIARALMDYDPRLTPLLQRAGFGGVRVTTS